MIMRIRTAAIAGAALCLAATLLPASPAHAAGTVAPAIQINHDFPDPDIVSDGTTWHAYATSSGGNGTDSPTASGAQP
jgi:Spy/CpxP family protein refolding chaperone